MPVMETKEINKIVESFKLVDFSELRAPIIAVYEHPLDFPNYYVARIWDVNRQTNTIILRESLGEIETDVLNNTSCTTFFLASKYDDPHLVGTYI